MNTRKRRIRQVNELSETGQNKRRKENQAQGHSVGAESERPSTPEPIVSLSGLFFLRLQL